MAHSAEFQLMKFNFENSWAYHPGFDPAYQKQAYQNIGELIVYRHIILKDRIRENVAMIYIASIAVDC